MMAKKKVNLAKSYRTEMDIVKRFNKLKALKKNQKR